MKVVWLVLAAATLAVPMIAEEGTDLGPVFRVDFSDPNRTPSHWTMTLHPDGSGYFRSEQGSGAGEAADEIKAPKVDREIRVSGEFAKRVFQAARLRKLFSGDCESHLKVAFQGWKTLSYSGPEGAWGCAFNYAKSKDMEALGDSLVAVADTILEGARLESLLQYDRLGLDGEMEFLAEAAGDGRAQEICAIRGILERLAEDPEVLERVRKRARVLLAKAGTRD